MLHHRNSIASTLTALSLTLLLVAPAGATGVIFQVDSSQSSITLGVEDSVYGTGVSQLPGSDTTSIRGHFLVKFDPLSPGGPTSIQFVPGHGYSLFDLTSGGANLQPGNAPANLALESVGGEAQIALRNISWDWASAALPITPPVVAAASSTQFSATDIAFPSTSIQYNVLSGTESISTPIIGNETFSAVGITGGLASGISTLTQTSPGHWKLALNFSMVQEQALLFVEETATLTFQGTIIATARFGTENVAQKVGISERWNILGGSTQVGGVTLEFLQGGIRSGTLTAQQIGYDGLSQASLAAAALNSAFLVSNETFSASPQIWNLDLDGVFNNGPHGFPIINLIFHYDPALLPEGIDESQLGFWHFGSDQQWRFYRGEVNTEDHTISVLSGGGFSPFMLGINVPEPSTFALAVVGGVAVILTAGRRKAIRRHQTTRVLRD